MSRLVIIGLSFYLLGSILGSVTGPAWGHKGHEHPKVTAEKTETAENTVSTAPEKVDLVKLRHELPRLRKTDWKHAAFVFINPACTCTNDVLESLQALTKENNHVPFFIVDSVSEKKDSTTKYVKAMETKGAAFHDGKKVLQKMFDAKATPESFLVDEKGVILYSGVVVETATDRDPASDEKKAVESSGLALAMDEIKNGKPISHPHTKGEGCIINPL